MHAKSHSFTQQCILHAACATYYIPSCLSLNRDTILCVCVQGIAVAQEHHHQGCSETRWIRVLHANVYIVYLMRRNKYMNIFSQRMLYIDCGWNPSWSVSAGNVRGIQNALAPLSSCQHINMRSWVNEHVSYISRFECILAVGNYIAQPFINILSITWRKWEEFFWNSFEISIHIIYVFYLFIINTYWFYALSCSLGKIVNSIIYHI